ncbi:hypothetical protein BV25DRAFT_1820814 [Artomyces pyxidatus]|uniref:Uncharacterized protein n=1 Tax=Artomyces pyxidatus TaxID=48021 RepID=A0ACB8TE99_9AGAM|nr:hypothetical protein BV25DRAFT_1820814 [Artomyces pyxidatus]
MKGVFVGPMPVKQFLKDFLPAAPRPRPRGNLKFRSKLTQKTFEQQFACAVNDSLFCPSLEFVDTKHKGGRNFRSIRKPDISACLRDLDPAPQARDRVDWPEMEIHLEVKPEDGDLFVDHFEGSENRSLSFEHSAGPADKARGQIISYTQAQHSSQFRCFTFSVCLIGTDMARLIRWDRTGAVVTERFHWRGRSTALVEFLWRYEHLSAEERGHDTTVTEASEDEVDEALPVLEESGHWPDGVPLPLHKILVHDDETGHDHEFIAPSAVSASMALTGRASAGYIAYDLEKKVCVYVKDTWRIDMDGMEKEGSIYHRLHKHDVPHIPHLVCSGDVGDQKTRTQDYVNAAWACWTRGVIPHRHYRLVLDTIGRAIETFDSTRQLCKGLCDALEAHWIAFSKAKVLHRDISTGNVLLTEDGSEGLLIDWDLCKIIEDEQAPRQEWRTGTWQFLSAALLMDPKDKRHELSDDLESGMWVLTYNLLKFRPSVFEALGEDLFNVFDMARKASNGLTVGGRGKRAFLKNSCFEAVHMRKSYPRPCAGLVNELRKLFNPLYYREGEAEGVDEPDEELAAAAAAAAAKEKADSHAAVQTSLEVLRIFRTWLAEDGWPEDDGSEEVDLGPTKIEPSTPAQRAPTTSGKRTRDAMEGEDRHVSTASSKKRKSAVPQLPSKSTPLPSLSEQQ